MRYLSYFLKFSIVLCSVIGLSFLFPNDLDGFVYYTNLSVLAVLVFYIYYFYVVLTHKDSRSISLMRIKGAITIAILLTFIVYAILLAPKAKPEDFYHLSNYTKHYIVPILTFVDWLLFDTKNNYKKHDPLLWTIFPLLYCFFSLIKGVIFKIPIIDEPNSPFPYFFLNVDKYGWGSMWLYVGIIALGYVIIGYGMYFTKRNKLTNK